MPRNTLVCFTNCKLALENGSIVQHDLWFDKQKGIIVDAQVKYLVMSVICCLVYHASENLL